MKIGITGSVTVSSFSKFLKEDEEYLSKLTFGRAGTAVNNLIEGLLERGHKISVYTLDLYITAPVVLENGNFKLFIGPYRKQGWRRMLNFFQNESACIKSFIEKDKPDIVNAHWSYEYADGAIRSGYPHLITFRDSAWEILKFNKDLYRFVKLFLDYWVKSRGKNFSANSKYLQEKLSGVKAPIAVIANPISKSYIKETAKNHPKEKIKIVSILTGWGKRKNPIPALKAFRQVREELGTRVEYYIYGPDYGPDEAAYQWAIKNKLAEGVWFLGQHTHSDIMKVLDQYDILLHPALEESFGNTLLEGMAMGLPVVAGKNSGAVPWVLNHGKNGVLVDVNSVKEIKEALLSLIKEEALYENMSHKGLLYVKENFSSEVIAEKYEKLYYQIKMSDQKIEIVN